MEIIQKELRRSRLYGEFSWKRFENQIRVPALVSLGVWTLIISMEVWKIGQMSFNQVHFLY